MNEDDCEITYGRTGRFYIDKTGQMQFDRRTQRAQTFQVPILMSKPSDQMEGLFYIDSSDKACLSRREKDENFCKDQR